MRAIIATLGYVLSGDRRQVLLLRRDRRPDDLHWGYHNGLGGKLEPGEDVVAGMRREIREESGLEARTVELAGTISWPGFGRDGENWFGFLFRIPDWSGEPYRECPEGTLVWTDLADVLAGRVSMWPSDRHFLPLVFAERPAVFHGVMPFADRVALDWRYSLTD
ncbi:8-oxo-dGTP diphosphatase [Plantactinospora sp. KBS50]|uniref:NUDIX hydrolase n=1 Tax=Plantactinospora sp. KBS50 TaxID=2024580 RepID=UPI000BAB098D|nr:8-oxo-dGTP diphosphatase [Plantactinospora sp. KBS50]ASW56719.1 7,8-dihydro-8-oxoguanine triphosphatase [Plantactinospora sp. KBS50]